MIVALSQPSPARWRASTSTRVSEHASERRRPTVPRRSSKHQVALAASGAPVGHPQQPRVLLAGQRAGLAERDGLRADLGDLRVSPQRVSERAQRREVLSDRRRGAPLSLESIAPRPHSFGAQGVEPGGSAEPGAKRTIDTRVGGLLRDC